MKSQLILFARGLSINNQKLVDLFFQPLTTKHEIRVDAFSNPLVYFISYRLDFNGCYDYRNGCQKMLTLNNCNFEPKAGRLTGKVT